MDSDCSCDDLLFCRPALPRIRSCLKSSPSHSGASTPSSDGSFTTKKHVAFREDGTEEVYEADEWDRTPAEIQRLSYEYVTRFCSALVHSQARKGCPRVENAPARAASCRTIHRCTVLQAICKRLPHKRPHSSPATQPNHRLCISIAVATLATT